MTTDTTIYNITKAFEKVFEGTDKLRCNALDNELIKIQPSENSQVLLSTDYDEEENSVGLSIYVSNPQTGNHLVPLSFDKLMYQFLIRTQVSKLENIWECISLMERKEGNKYSIDFIPVFYNNELDDYYLHLRITKIPEQ